VEIIVSLSTTGTPLPGCIDVLTCVVSRSESVHVVPIFSIAMSMVKGAASSPGARVATISEANLGRKKLARSDRRIGVKSSFL
jgi:hypothetical protein